MKFMFIEAESIKDAADFFERVVIPDFWHDQRVKLDDAITVAKEYSARLSKQGRDAVEIAVAAWNSKNEGRPWGEYPFDGSGPR